MREFKKERVPKPRSDIGFPQLDCDISLEIGCGVGLHPILWANNKPDEHLIAIERTKEKFLKLQKRLDNHDFQNITAIHDDAIHWVTHNVPARSLKNIFILYPNPEPSNANQRFSNMPFMSFLVERLTNDGRLTFATNIESYYREVKKKFVLDFGLKCLEDKTLDSSFSPRTHFEKKYLNRGESCYNLVFEPNIRR